MLMASLYIVARVYTLDSSCMEKKKLRYNQELMSIYISTQKSGSSFVVRSLSTCRDKKSLA